MITSNAAGCPTDQLGNKMSPSRELVFGIRFFCSLIGAMFAVEQGANILSLILS